ncbi:glycerol-3-phosphate acyltransferase 2, mitochondrial [Clupea harengus]|uniref:Glycerol-3-phosphate acyltransferase 2, mitochondrial n=1 Tax=Clupea harengus TaxID=7950 RepID=A0A6P8FSH7_CLUHA|nr:glycerol-3-phosphate acyltransferase 2, mitochondrial [Clupea harengus]XP_031426064.1 glycerol-3-phosphate acyltransferase 2, mitochondrial [Clupea harengus]XP_031426065.1 glycerol-3-phosphate acyltransferase 2, mitochondrial [Clupea harengus]XP_031426066.1 glycerol-3-phosphate acyltransferase 2, mitochondrial [Clupea harengus]XP_031426067.1 glycerol-3-phosphate acyltransferase 2, mitochondrial [Clupea harengus]
MAAEIGAGDGPAAAAAAVPAPSKSVLSWGVKIRKKLKTVTPFLGKFRPLVGQCCHKCSPESLGLKLLQNTPSLGFQNLLNINETHTRYRGWLVRRVCCVLFVGGCRVYSSQAHDRLHRICCSDRAWGLLSNVAHSADESVLDHLDVSARARAREILSLTTVSISPALLRLVGWFLLKLFDILYCSVQVNLNQLAALRRAAQLNTPLVFVSVRQSCLDQALIALVLFCHSLRVPYTITPVQVNNSFIRAILQRLGVILLPCGAVTEQDAEMDRLYSPIMSALTGVLLQEGESLSLTLAADSGHGGQWLARVRQALLDGLAADANLVPVAVSYDCPPEPRALPQGGVMSIVQSVVSLLWRGRKGSVRIHFAQAFSLKEMSESGRFRVDRGRPLQELLLPTILNNRSEVVYGDKSTSWVLPASFMPELQPEERQLTIGLTMHLIHSTTSCMALMATQLISCLLLHKHHKGVRVSVLCREVSWLLEEVLFRRRDVGFAGSLVEVVYSALTLLSPHLLMAAPPPTAEPLLVPGPRPAARLALARHAHALTHTFITEAVGACAVSAMLSEVACCGDVGEMEFDVALCQEELTDRALQLTHLLPAGYIPPCQSAQTFALDAVDSVVRCGILIMEEVPRGAPVCDIMKRQGTLRWNAADESDYSDSDCGEQEARSYKLSQPAQCPDMLFFLCSLLSVQLRALCWAIQGLHLLPTPLPASECLTQLHAYAQSQASVDRGHHESSSMDLVKTSVRTLIDLGVLTDERENSLVHLDLSPVFQQTENREKLHKFVSQYLYN